MKCEILYGPETGAIKHFANNDPTAHNLIKSGLLRLVENEVGDLVKMPNGQIIPKMQPPAEPKWYVGLVGAFKPSTQFSQGGDVARIPAIVFEIGSTTYERFVGEPKDVKQAWSHRAVPAEIMGQYKKLHEEFYEK